MAESVEQSLPKEDRRLFFAPQTLKRCLLGWLIPGFGYYLSGRKKSWILMTACIWVAFIMGVLLQGDLYPWAGEGKIRSIGAICQMGSGIPYFLAKIFLDRGSPLNLTYDYGTNYFLIAGMINWLAVLDTFDISVKRK